ncbi:MAG: hypothetical protein JSV44_10590 [Candidatus Zixiibacteriota bacterium]|nr:MAG: hypothetical protein JSV44_10590 [candidate division Zixibacteria bacterium]
MKRLIITLILVAMAFSVAGARKKNKAGSVKDSTYTDSKFGFSLVIPDAWKYNIKKNKSDTRLILTKKNYEIPTHFQHAPNYTTVPKVTVLVDTTSLSVKLFVDSLLSDNFKSKQKKSILAEFPLLFGDFQLKKRAKMSIGDAEGVRISGQQQYTIQVQRSGSESNLGDVVTDFYGGSVFFAKQENIIVMMHFICEWRYYQSLDQEFNRLIEGFEFVEK